MATFAFTDNGDQTATVTITGADPSSAYIIYSLEIGETTDLATNWTAEATDFCDGSGDASETFAIDAGFYFFHVLYVQSTLPTLSTVAYRRISPADSAIADQILDAVRAKLITLALTDVENNSIVVGKWPTTRDLGATVDSARGQGYKLPAIRVTPGQAEQMPSTRGTNNRDDVTYPVMLTMYDKGSEAERESLPKYQLWRENIAQAFRNQRLDGVSQVINCEVSPNVIASPLGRASDFYVGQMQLNFISRETRG